jgi:hypothetical protein
VGSAVQGDVNALFLAFGAVALIVGGLGIANVTLLSVKERTGEIGLRRAVGARRRHIAAQFLIESAVTGLLGGLIGAALGIVAVVGVCVAKDWTPILDVRVALFAPLIGGLGRRLSGDQGRHHRADHGAAPCRIGSRRRRNKAEVAGPAYPGGGWPRPGPPRSKRSPP